MQRYKKWCGKVLKCAKKNPQIFLRIDVVEHVFGQGGYRSLMMSSIFTEYLSAPHPTGTYTIVKSPTSNG